MVGDRLGLIGPVAAGGEQRLRRPVVQPGPAQRRELSEHGVADEGMREPVAVAVGDEDAGDDRGVEGVEATVGVALAGGHRRTQIEALAERRRHLQLERRTVWQLGEAAAHDVADRLGHAVLVGHAALAGEPCQFGDEQRVATGP